MGLVALLVLRQKKLVHVYHTIHFSPLSVYPEMLEAMSQSHYFPYVSSFMCKVPKFFASHKRWIIIGETLKALSSKYGGLEAGMIPWGI